MKRTKILYWVFTSLFGLLMLSSGAADALSAPDAVKGVHDELGYPIYFIPFIGVAKMLGVLAILIPAYPKLKEWAYAGLAFDLLGATYSLLCVPQAAAGGQWYMMILPLGLFACSYIFYHKKLNLAVSGISDSKEGKLELQESLGV